MREQSAVGNRQLEMKRFNWQLWAGFLLSVFGFLSFPLLFVNWPTTRDFPWANLLLYGLSAILLIIQLLSVSTRRKPTGTCLPRRVTRSLFFPIRRPRRYASTTWIMLAQERAVRISPRRRGSLVGGSRSLIPQPGSVHAGCQI